MKKPELDSILKRARLPEISEASLELFPRRVVGRIKRDEAPRAARNFFPRLAWIFGLALCGLLAFGIIHRGGQTKIKFPTEFDSLASAKVIRETLALFPNRVRAIVSDERGLNLVLSDHDDVPDSEPLYVRICDGQHCSSVVTFSGQEIEMAGQKISVLADGRGEIILAGENFVWSKNDPAYARSHWKIEAKNFGAVTM